MFRLSERIGEDDHRSDVGQGSLRLSRIVMGIGRGIGRILPATVRRRVENRLFYSVFQATRVTNDAYGWRPKEDE